MRSIDGLLLWFLLLKNNKNSQTAQTIVLKYGWPSVADVNTDQLYDATAYYWQLLRKKAIFKQYKFFSHCCWNSLFSKNIIYKCVHFNTKRFSFSFMKHLNVLLLLLLWKWYTHIIHHFSQKLIQVIMFFHFKLWIINQYFFNI